MKQVIGFKVEYKGEWGHIVGYRGNLVCIDYVNGGSEWVDKDKVTYLPVNQDLVEDEMS